MYAFIVALCQYLALLGALAWGVIGFTGVDALDGLFGKMSAVVKMSIGVAALILLIMRFF